ncbi:MAG TPA: rod shape-determining protein MreD [Kribbellaceae bacterium]|jgi:rod shape-determining protein MreD
MRNVRAVVTAVVLVLAVTFQLSALPHIAIAGVTCDLALLAVIGFALARGPEFGALTGFAGGLLLDLAPPADHTAGRWALALTLAGYLGGLIRREGATPITPWQVGISVLLCTSLAHIVFAATGALLRDPNVERADVGARLGIAIGYDLLAAIVVVPLVMWGIGRLESATDRRGASGRLPL